MGPRHEREEVSHKLTSSSLVTQTVYKRATACHCYCHYHRVPGEIKRREVELDPQASPEEIMSREVELGCESWTSFASDCSSTAAQRTLSLRLCPAWQLKQQLRSALVWWWSTVFLVFFGQYPQGSPVSANSHSLVDWLTPIALSLTPGHA